MTSSQPDEGGASADVKVHSCGRVTQSRACDCCTPHENSVWATAAAALALALAPCSDKAKDTVKHELLEATAAWVQTNIYDSVNRENIYRCQCEHFAVHYGHILNVLIVMMDFGRAVYVCSSNINNMADTGL